MIIDFHTHVFPEKLAERAITTLFENSGKQYNPVTDGTINGLLNNMDKWGIDISITLPIITKPAQFKSTNDWAKLCDSTRITAFGSLYPHTDDYKRDIDYIANLGLKGIKFHAEYQNFILDEPKMLKIYDYAFEKGLIIVHHAGYDPAFKPPFKTSPKKFVKVIDAMKGGIMIAAHLGGHSQWDEVLEYLAGRDIYLDTSMGFEYYGKKIFLKILKAHGADKILFASDAPWSNAKNEVDAIKKLPLDESQKEAVLYRNAAKILGKEAIIHA